MHVEYIYIEALIAGHRDEEEFKKQKRAIPARSI